MVKFAVQGFSGTGGKGALRAVGRSRAEFEYASGIAQYESYGLRLLRANLVHRETGLWISDFGCAVLNGEGIESEAYNDRLLELVEESGVPDNAIGVKERYEKATAFHRINPRLRWVSVPRLHEGIRPTDVELAGGLRVRRDSYLDHRGARKTRLRVISGGEVLTTLDVTAGARVAAALWANAELLVVHEFGANDKIYFVDLVHGRLIHTWIEWLHNLFKRPQQVQVAQIARVPPGDLVRAAFLIV